MKNTATPDLTRNAFDANALLEARGISDRWTLDVDNESNSVGTWWLGDCGGVTTSIQMSQETYAAIARHDDTPTPAPKVSA